MGAAANHFSTTDRKQISALFIDVSFQAASNRPPQAAAQLRLNEMRP
jgi:hypothetical protein